MLGFLTYEAVVFLAQKRLAALRDALAAKINDGVAVNQIDRQVHHLAKKACEFLAAAPKVDVALPATSFAPWVIDDVSRFAMLGGLGPEIPRYSGLLAQGQRWLFDTIHNGNPDPDLARVRAGSTDLALEIFTRANAAVDAGGGTDTEKTEKRNRVRAFTLGHLCHVAADVIIHPMMDDAIWQLADGTWVKLSPETAALALERRVADRIFSQNNFASGNWLGWLPSPGDVPDALFDAYVGGLEAVYGSGATVQGSKAWRDRPGNGSPPALSPFYLKEGYRNWHTLISRDYGWSYPTWLGATAPLFVPTLISGFVIHKLQNGKLLFGDNAATADKERGWYELIGLPMAFNGFLTLGYFLYASIGTHLGLGRETVVALVSGILSALGAIGWFITGFNPDNKLGSGGTDVGLRWALIIALPAVAEIVQIIYGLSRARGQEVQSLLAGAPLVHLLSVGLFLLVYWAWLQPAAESGLEAGESWWRLLLWVLLVGGLWALCAWFFHLGGRSRRLGLSNLSTWLGGQPGALGDPRYVRLFDDATLFNAPTETQPTLDKRYYPSDRRPILRLWWEGPGELWVRSRRDHLEFGFAANPPANTIQRVLAPLGPMTLADFATYLGRAIREAANPGPFGGFTNKLKAEKHADVDWDYVLPAGLLFAAFGDDRDTVAAAQAANDAFQKLPVAQASAFVLHHIPRAHSSGRFGLAGPVDLRTDTGPVDGAGNIAALVAPNQVQGNAATRFWTFFRPGDRIRTKALATNETRVVTRVISDQLLELNRPFTAAVVAGTNYERLPDDRENDLNGPGSLSPGIDDFTLIGAGVDDFEAMLMPGDVLRITGGGTRGVEERTVVAVVTVRTLTIDRPLLKVLDRAGTTPPARYVRVGRRTLAGLAAVPTSSTDLFAGRSLLDHAADFAALLCLGGTTQMLIGNAERTPTGAPMIDRAGQVFRNWNLDHRRLNEWRMLVAGGATSERGASAGRMVHASAPAAPGVGDGPKTADRLGWVPLLRRYVDTATRRGVDSRDTAALRPGDPPNRDVSRGLAWLLGLADS